MAFINASRPKFPEVEFRTCVFHIGENLRRNGLFYFPFFNNNLILILFLAQKHGLTCPEVEPIFPKLNRLVKGLLYTNQSDTLQNEWARDIIGTFYGYDLGDRLLTANFRKYLDYVLQTWFGPNSAHFVGKLSNFHQEILSEITPVLTNNCSESLNACLKDFFGAGFISKGKTVEGNFKFKIPKKLLNLFF